MLPSEYEGLWAKAIIEQGPLPNELLLDKNRGKFYQQSYKRTIKKILQSFFTRLATYFEIDWESIAATYGQEFPPQNYEINSLSFHFDSFLEKHYHQLLLPPYLADIASYEIAEFKAVSFKFSQKENFFLNPSLQVLSFEFDVLSWIVQKEEASSVDGPIRRETFSAFSRPQPSKQNMQECFVTKLEIIDRLLIEIGRSVSNKHELFAALYDIDEKFKTMPEKFFEERLAFLKAQCIFS